MTAETTPARYPEFATWAEEVAALDTALDRLDPEDWLTETTFKRWRVFDHVHHLNLSDGLAEQAVARPEEFRADRRASVPGSIGGLGRDGTPDIPPHEMLERWREGNSRLAEHFERLEPAERIPWFGPDMSVRAFVTARQMETWSHGQTIHDALGIERKATDRIRAVCEIGWRTRGWSYGVNAKPMPGEPVFLELAAPSGAVWTWGDETAANRISGAAEHFALVVCQCRNVVDTELKVEGDAAREWMSIAQCFAGSANPPPAPGSRVPRQGATIA